MENSHHCIFLEYICHPDEISGGNGFGEGKCHVFDRLKALLLPGSNSLRSKGLPLFLSARGCGSAPSPVLWTGSYTSSPATDVNICS